MKTIIIALFILIASSMTAAAIDYDSLTEGQRASVDAMASFVGYTSGRSYYDAKVLETIAESDEKLRQERKNRVIRLVLGATDEQLDQLEAILAP